MTSKFYFTEKKVLSILFIAFIIFILLVWRAFHYPHSYREGVFLSNLMALSVDKTQDVYLGDLMPTNWELACESHGYDEPLYIENYRKFFPVVGAIQDGSWGIVFINKDGSFDSVSGACGYGMYLKFRGNRCLKKSEAPLSVSIGGEADKCNIVHVGR